MGSNPIMGSPLSLERASEKLEGGLRKRDREKESSSFTDPWIGGMVESETYSTSIRNVFHGGFSNMFSLVTIVEQLCLGQLWAFALLQA